MRDRAEIEADLRNGPTPTVDEFLSLYSDDDNWWWIAACGHHMNLFEDAVAERDAALAKIQELQNDAARLEHTADAACSAREQMRDENAALRKQGDLDRAHLTIAQAKIQRIKAAIHLLDQPGPYLLPEGHTGCEDIITGLAANALWDALAGPEDRNEP